MILAKTIKGYGMGSAGEAQNITHQQKKMNVEAIRRFRDRFNIPVPDDELENVPFSSSTRARRRCEYLHERRDGARRLPARAADEAPSRSTCRRSRRSSGS